MGRIRHIAKKFWLKDITQFEKGLVPLETYLDYDEEGRVVLAVNPTELYEPMNGKKASELNRDIFCYLDEKSDVIPLRYTLNIRFTGTYTEEQKQQITTLMKQHYQECYLSKRNELKFNALKSCYLGALGVILLGISFATGTMTNAFVSEFLSIAASFSMWECVDTFVLERRHIRNEMLNIAQMTFSEISFENT